MKVEWQNRIRWLAALPLMALLTAGLFAQSTVKVCKAPPSPLLFEDNFETGDTSKWTYFSSGQGTDVLVNATAAYAGSFGLWIQYNNATTDINRWVAKAITQEPSTIYVQERVYVKHPEVGGSVDNIQRKLFALYNGTGGSPGSEFGIFLTSDSGTGGTIPLRVSNNDNATCGVTAFSNYNVYTLQYDTWYLLEFGVKLNTPGSQDGEYWLYVDGTERAHGTAKDWRGTCSSGVGHVRVGLQADCAADSMNERRFIDNVKVARAYIGF